jgi:pimeloyl-ACP methyl ester carboxylesterase
VPDDWNRKLVVHMRGSHFSRTLRIQDPEMRSYFIKNGYAWAASSYSHEFAPELAANESAAVFDLFVQEFGMPERTYAVGLSLGGGAALISAERFADRYDGALTFCAVPPARRANESWDDFTIAALLVGGIESAELDLDDYEAVDTTLRSILSDPNNVAALTELWIRLTGGDRPLAEFAYVRDPPGYLSAFPYFFDNIEKTYILSAPLAIEGDPLGDISQGEFNQRALRHRGEGADVELPSVSNFVGSLRMPVLAVTVTGDTVVPLSDAQKIEASVVSAGSSDLFVHRAIQAWEHCRLTAHEQETQFEALVAWVEDGERPDGESVLEFDPETLGQTFTALPRVSSKINGRDLLEITGEVLTDESYISSTPFLRLIVENDGLLADCRLVFKGVDSDSQYAEILATKSEVAGCGEPGVRIFAEKLNACAADDRPMISTNQGIWPEEGKSLELDLAFSCADLNGVALPFTVVAGDLFASNGDRIWRDAKVEAFIGDALCGVTSLSPLARLNDRYLLLVSGPELRPGCLRDGTIELRVNGKPTRQKTVNSLDELSGGHGQYVDLIVDDD